MYRRYHVFVLKEGKELCKENSISTRKIPDICLGQGPDHTINQPSLTKRISEVTLADSDVINFPSIITNRCR